MSFFRDNDFFLVLTPTKIRVMMRMRATMTVLKFPGRGIFLTG